MMFFSMRLINVQAFLRREELIRIGKELDRRTSVFASRDDETTDYAILSHRWTEQEVNYDEMNDLAKMNNGDINEICGRNGYQKILDSCKRAKRDKCEWLWIDTCCIDKRSSAELSEAINSMYRWYENSRVCYAYLHDVADESFPAARDEQTYLHSNGWPEWFSRGWTLQEMLAPSNVQFFNKNWQFIGAKKTLASHLTNITRVPKHILTDGVRSAPPCVAQIISWAADRKTTRVEDRAYSLLGLLDVNMPMLYGEGKKAFHRLQLEIIRMSDDQSIFAWDYQRETGRTCSILADDPSCFKDCSEMVRIDLVDFMKEHKVTKTQLSIDGVHDEDQLGVFPVTNRGIQIWLFLRCLDDSDSVFEARLPCRPRAQSQDPVTIKLASWKHNYYRHFTSLQSSNNPSRFKRVYLRYQDMLHYPTFEIDDSTVTENGFEYCGTYPSKLAGKTLILTDTDPLYVEVYSDQATLCLAVGYGRISGQHWIHMVCHKVSAGQFLWEDYAKQEYKKMFDKRLEHAGHMIDVCPRSECYHYVLVKHTSLPGPLELTHTLCTSCVIWENSTICAVKFDIFHNFCPGPDKWTGFDIDVSRFSLILCVYLIMSLSL